MKAITYFLCIAIFSAALLSCKKNDDVVAAPVQTTLLLSKAIYSAVGTYDYTYDAQNRMKTETYSGNASNPGDITTFTGYDSDGKLTGYSVHYTTGAFTDYNAVITYNSSNKPDKMFYYNTTGPLLYYAAFTYAGSVITMRQYSAAGAVTSAIEYTYSADGKNVVQSKSYNSSGTLTSTTAYSNYDSKKAVDGLFPVGYSIAPANENNWQNLSRTGSTGVVTGFIATYQYNPEGYPVYRSTDNGSTIEYQYIKK